MNHYSIPLAKQELLHHMLQVGGKAAVHLHCPEQVIQADFSVELTDTHARCSVELGGHTGEVTLRRRDLANHLHLRDFIEDMANGRHESAAPAPAKATSTTLQPGLTTADEQSLRDICRFGGTRQLACAAQVSVHIAGTHHALVTLGTVTEHLNAASGGSLYAEVAIRLDQLLAA